MGKKVNPMGSKMPKGQTLAQANRALSRGDASMKALKASPAFRGKKGQRGDVIGAGRLYRGMKNPV